MKVQKVTVYFYFENFWNPDVDAVEEQSVCDFFKGC